MSNLAEAGPAEATAGAQAPADTLLPLLHGASHLVIGMAMLAILVPFVIVLVRRSDLVPRRLVGLACSFLLAFAVALLLGALHQVHPVPALAVVANAVAAGLAIVTAIAVWPALPGFLALRSPAVLAREVEERRAAEQRARESEARMGAFIAHLAEAIFVCRVAPDGAMRIETVNPAFERIFGVHAGLVLGRLADQVLPSAVVNLALPRWREAASRGTTLEFELTGNLPRGRVTWHTVLVPMRGADGRVDRLVGSARDVTSTRRLEAGLVQSARLATVGTLAAGLAHEASQPLNVATLWLRRARAAGAELPTVQRASLERAVGVVEDQLRRAGDLVARMRGLAGDETSNGDRFDIAPVVADAVRIAAAQYGSDGVRLQLERGTEPLVVRGNPTRLEESMLQLLSNARDAVMERRRMEPRAPAQIEVALLRDGGTVCIEVRDTGTGIADPIRDAIFDPFFTTKEPGRGTGLGLPFALGVARAMGGGIETWNLPEGGACFRMELAAAETEAPAEQAVPVPEPVPDPVA
ncbi:sensor histidine kinase [Falsiroseomonas sp. HW251]|uniref:sensor histidine kinase n=1 Tax=Falsiroseomonas sp. HW251 TaxID=3390998 RepID=UPI003D31EEF1